VSGPRPHAADHDRAPEPGQHFHLPAPTIWPLVCGAGVALLAFGLLTQPAFGVVGLLLIARALVGWIGELRRE
jgi:hypothetical protein